MSTEDNKARFRHLIRGFNQGNSDELFDAFSPDCQIQDERGVTFDKNSYRERLRQVTAAFPDYRLIIEDLLADGDKVVGRYTETGTMTGDFMDFEATGQKFAAPAIQIWQFENGLVTGVWIVSDTLTALSEIGVIAVETMEDRVAEAA